ncbi:NADP-dependent oxidoreductase [Streptomyces sp. NBC_00237]|uniref:NADP-dependent oxidoreductase n=1 Tax=Streptomyces sp. NBC_00237 TaxID=2975687 RepID=UPI002254906B|nr:NADP-dependent oxidoreductase [Streptomyces sp. NBC_00237]MCX5203031.1 NADP-dependent oxidoreductase [Streptomyces sp. NBC_00237]
MRAVAVRAFKALPEPVEVPAPVAEPGRVLVKVAAAGLNPVDWLIADGMLDGVAPHVFPLVMGADFAGTVTAVGDGVTRFAVGDEIFGQVGGAAIGAGSYAEYVSASEDAPLARAPKSVPLAHAAALPVAGMTAAQILEAAAVREGESLLVIGAGGGVGTYLTQLAAGRDVRVLAAVRGDARQRMGALGAAVTVDTTAQDLASAVRDEYPDGVDALVDLASRTKEDFAANAALVHDGGVALTSLHQEDPARAPRGVEVIGFEMSPSGDLLATLARAVDAGQLKIDVEAEVPLERAPEAVAKSRSGGARGKTLIVP